MTVFHFKSDWLLVWYGAEYGEYLRIPKSDKTLGPKAPKKKAADRIKNPLLTKLNGKLLKAKTINPSDSDI